MTEVRCNGTERTLASCDAEKLPAEDGKGLHNVIDAAGVRCISTSAETAGLSGAAKAGVTAGAIVLAVLVGISLVVIIAYVYLVKSYTYYCLLYIGWVCIFSMRAGGERRT